MDELGSFPATISVRARMTLYRDFRNIVVQEKIYNDFKGTCFGHLRYIPKYYKFNGQMVHYMLLGHVKNDKFFLHEMWFCVNDKHAFLA